MITETLAAALGISPFLVDIVVGIPLTILVTVALGHLCVKLGWLED